MKLPTICVFGLGAGTLDQMTLSTYKRLQNSDMLYMRTKEHPVLKELEAEGLTFQSFDNIYEAHDNFTPVYEEIAETLIAKATTSEEPVNYAVPGHPLVAEETVQRLIQAEKENRVELEIVGGQSFLDPVFSSLRIDPSEGMQLLDATQFTGSDWMLRQHLILTQVYDTFTASNVKLSLMEQVPDDYEVKVVTHAGSPAESVESMPLYELDHHFKTTNLAIVYVPPVTDESQLAHTFQRLRDVISTLRSPEGCPWDREQTHQSLKKYLLEETYEVLAAIDEEDDEHLIEELGDVLLQVMLHSQIGEDEGFFTIDDVIKTLTEKMIRRHPHVFKAERSEQLSSTDVLSRWDEIKLKEKGETDEASLLAGIPPSMPALMTSFELQKKAAKAGFSWDEAEPMWAKLQEEVKEWQEALKEFDAEEAKKELGDVLFIIVNLARYYKLQPEEALFMTNEKFKFRFNYIEKRLQNLGKNMSDVDLEEMDRYWDEAKERERNKEDL